MGALSTSQHISALLQPTQEEGQQNHVQVNVRGQAERNYRVTTAHLHVHWFDSEPELNYQCWNHTDKKKQKKQYLR